MLIRKKGDLYMKTKMTKIPKFKSVEEEAEFWDTHSIADYWNEFDPVDLVVALAKPKEETLVLRINRDVKTKLEKAAKDKGVTISTLARILLAEKLRTL
jgi:hypothetical protein